MDQTGVCEMFKDVIENMTKKDFRCVVARWLDSLSEEDCKMVLDAIQEHGSYVTFKACRNYGFQGGETAFNKHARGVCPCSSTR